MIKEYFLNYEAMNNDFTIGLGCQNRIDYHDAHGEQDFLVTLAETGLESMTGGRIRRVRRYVEDETFMVTYGDGVSDVDIRKLLRFHQEHGKLATVTAVQPTSRFGILDLDGEPGQELRREAEARGMVECRLLRLRPAQIFDYLSGDECILEREPLERLALEGQLMVYRHGGFFYAMDTYREYEALNAMWDEARRRGRCGSR